MLRAFVAAVLLLIAAPAAAKIGAGTLVDLGTPSITTSLAAGDLIRLDAKDATGHSIFGAIERKAS